MSSVRGCRIPLRPLTLSYTGTGSYLSTRLLLFLVPLAQSGLQEQQMSRTLTFGVSVTAYKRGISSLSLAQLSLAVLGLAVTLKIFRLHNSEGKPCHMRLSPSCSRCGMSEE